MNSSRRVTVIPLVGPFHTRFPLYNVVHVRELLCAAAPTAVALAALPPAALSHPGWRATPEIALPHTVVPWAQRRGLKLVEVGSQAGLPGEPGEAGDEEAFMRYLDEFAAGKAHLREVQAALRPAEELLGRALDMGRILGELVPALDDYHELRSSKFGEGPGTGWRAARAERMAQRVGQIEDPHTAVLVGVDDYGAMVRALTEALDGQATVEEPPRQLQLSEEASREARQRSLLDVAMRGEVEDPSGLLGQLRSMATPEASYHEANILLAHGHAAEALEKLKQITSGDFHEPYYLPGFVLARLGELQDMAGDRQAALRAYRRVLALSYAPPEAVEAAEAGLERPFQPQPEERE